MGDALDGTERTLPQLLSTTGPMALTVAWLEIFDRTGSSRERATGAADVITSMVSELIAQEVLFERDAA